MTLPAGFVSLGFNVSTTYSIGKLAVIGPGLLGGSLCLAARDKQLAKTIALWGRRAEVLKEASEGGFADEVSDNLRSVVMGADLIVLCTPVGAMPGLLNLASPWLKQGCLVTDVGSVKEDVVRTASAALAGSGAPFVGSHPMAGSEQSGLSAARRDLFDGAVCILTPVRDTPKGATAQIDSFWQAIGMRTCKLTPQAHDKVIATVSHLPHLLAAILVDFVCSQPGNPVNYAGSGLRDTTRVASGPVEMWNEILATNRVSVAAALRGLASRIEEVVDLLESRDTTALKKLLADAKQQRDQLICKKTNG